jgi:hypothetical protein
MKKGGSKKAEGRREGGRIFNHDKPERRRDCGVAVARHKDGD